MQNGSKFQWNRLGPETRAWVRTLDAVLTLGCAFSVTLLFFGYLPESAPRMLHLAFYGALVGIPIVAWTLYRETSLTRLERIAVILPVLALGFALMSGALEAGRVA